MVKTVVRLTKTHCGLAVFLDFALETRNNIQSVMISFADLIGKPFIEGGRGPDAYDCVGLLKECWFRWHKFELPEYPYFNEPEVRSLLIDKEIDLRWKKLPWIEPGAALLVRIAGFGAHVGFVVSETKMIHSSTAGVKIERIGAFRHVIGAYTYER